MNIDLYFILIYLCLLSEVIMLAFIEKKLWNTYYTPLNFLMIPYFIVMNISVLTVNIYDLYPFYAESLYVWMLGLLCFATPSWAFACIREKILPKDAPATQQPFAFDPKILFFVAFPLLVVYYLHVRSVLASAPLTGGIGSDELGENILGKGIWAHMFNFFIVIEIISLYFFSKKNWYLIIIFILCFLICIINQVKSWIMIPVFACLILKIITGKVRISLRTILFTLLFGFGFFFLSYYLSIVTSEGNEFDDKVVEYITRNFIHYLTSGVLGLSMDMDKGILEQQDLTYIFAPFCNVYNLITGNEMASCLNTFYLTTTWLGFATNIRTFIGTIYVFSGPWTPIVIAFWSSFIYFFKLMSDKTRQISWLLAYAWLSALLTLGWFDYYFALLNSLEVIVLFFIICYLFNLISNKDANRSEQV